MDIRSLYISYVSKSIFSFAQKMTQSIEEWFDFNHSLTVACAILAASLGSNPGIPIVSQQNAIDLTL